MNLLPGRAQRDHFCEEGHEVTAVVASCASSVHAAGLGVQCGIQRKRSVAVVLEAVTLGSSQRKRQHGSSRSKGLDGGFLIDAEHGGMLRRPQIQADNVGGFAFELRVVAGQVTLQAMGFRPASFQTRCTASLLTPRAVASLRQLQWVEPSLGFLQVADRIRARKAGVSTVACWPG